MKHHRGIFRTKPKIELFTKIANNFQLITIFAKKLYHRCLKGSEHAPALNMFFINQRPLDKIHQDLQHYSLILSILSKVHQ